MPDARVHRGPEEVRRDYEQMFDLYEEYWIEIEDYYEAGDDVVVFVRYWGRGRSSGAEVEAEMANVFTSWRDGIATVMRQYIDRTAALEAAGIPARGPVA